MAIPERDDVYSNNNTERNIYTRESSGTGWFVGIIVALALLAIGYLVFSANSGPSTPATDTAPSVESPAVPPATSPAPMTEAPAPATEPAPMTEAPATPATPPATDAAPATPATPPATPAAPATSP